MSRQACALSGGSFPSARRRGRLRRPVQQNVSRSASAVPLQIEGHSTPRRLTKRGPAFLKVGALVRYSPEDLDAWLASLPTGGTAIHKQLASGPAAREVESGK